MNYILPENTTVTIEVAYVDESKIRAGKRWLDGTKYGHTVSVHGHVNGREDITFEIEVKTQTQIWTDIKGQTASLNADLSIVKIIDPIIEYAGDPEIAEEIAERNVNTLHSILSQVVLEEKISSQITNAVLTAHLNANI